jgi:hypothetical protein
MIHVNAPCRQAVCHEGKYLPEKGKPVPDLRQRVAYAVTFIRMAEKEMRELAETTPEIARELGTIADQFHAEADDLARHIAE